MIFLIIALVKEPWMENSFLKITYAEFARGSIIKIICAENPRRKNSLLKKGNQKFPVSILISSIAETKRSRDHLPCLLRWQFLIHLAGYPKRGIISKESEKELFELPFHN
jgi:hypothetical protein